MVVQHPVRHPQDRHHQQIARPEFAAEPVRRAKPVRRLVQALVDAGHDRGQAGCGPGRVGLEQHGHGVVHERRFQRVQGGECPFQLHRPRRRRAWHQAGEAFGNVPDDRTAFEQDQVTVLQRRHLAEGLARPVRRPLLRALGQQAHGIGLAHLLQRPPDAQVTDLAPGEIRNPVEGGDGDLGRGINRHGGPPHPACRGGRPASRRGPSTPSPTRGRRGRRRHRHT